MANNDAKRQKMLPPVITSVVVVGGSCLSLIGHFLSFQEFLWWRRTCTSIRDCTRDRLLRWERYNELLTDVDVLFAMCNDMYGFITSKLDAPDYYEDRPDLLPKSYFPNSQQLARASMSLLAPEILFKIPLRLLNAMGGIDAVALLPNTRLLPRHFRIESIPPRMCKALSLKSEDFTAPITLCYDDILTVIAFRCFLSRDDVEPIVTHWYTCLNEVEWWCEFPHSAAVEFHYDELYNPYRAAFELSSAVQLGQMPPSPLSFFRPYDYGPDPYTRAHPTVWDAMEYLHTLVSARSVAHIISITHKETFVRLAESPFPPVKSVLFALLDCARTQIRLPLVFGTMLPSWSPYIALESALAVNNASRQVTKNIATIGFSFVYPWMSTGNCVTMSSLHSAFLAL